MFRKLNAAQSKQIRTIIIIHDYSVVRSIWHQKQLCFIEHDRRFWNFDVFICANRLYKIDASIINYQFNCSNHLIFRIFMCFDHYTSTRYRERIFRHYVPFILSNYQFTYNIHQIYRLINAIQIHMMIHLRQQIHKN